MPDPRRLIKTYGTNIPAAITAGESASHMTPSSPFTPGTPIGPYDGFSRTPRSHNFVTNFNIATRPRTHERVSFDTLRGLVEAYDVAQMCIWHRIDSIRSLDWSLVAKAGYGGDVTDAIETGMRALAKPDRELPFSSWLAAWLYDILAYDAGTLYRLRNRRKDPIGLRVVDGTTIAPLLDYWGNSPAAVRPEDPEPEAYVQYVNGLPWGWLTRSDVIYQPFRKRANSPYGTAPLESILLNANTDLRFQSYFLQRFTDGNVPEAFASAPESWTPQQIESFQELWDTAMYGDQAAKHQIRWMPGGSKIEWSNEKDFQDHFSLFLMRKTAAAYHIVPSDLGFTESVNRSSGESQADVQHRVGDLPLIRHVQTILSNFLQEDLKLPLCFLFDLGEEQADRLEQAQADKIYMELGVIGGSDLREMRYGLPEPAGQPMPRFVFTNHAGPIPLASLYAVAGQIDAETGAPEPGTELPHTAFSGAEGVTPNPPIKVMPLAEQEYGPAAMPEAPPPQPVTPDPGAVEKDGGAPTAGITTATGITSYDLVGRHDDEDDEEEDQAELAKAELSAFRKFTKARCRAGAWRDFEFRHVDPIRSRRLNQTGRSAVRKAAGEVSVAGLAVQAADTGRVLMLQRCLDPEDPAGGMFEFPGGHLEGDEKPLMGAWREWAEETGCLPPPGERAGSWTSPNGVYQGIVWRIDSEAMVPVRGDREVGNPDDPDGDCVEAIAWMDPGQLAGNPAVRSELLADLDLVLAALGCQDGTGQVEKAADGPKGQAPDGASQPPPPPVQSAWPGWVLDLDTVAHWAPVLAAGLAAAVIVHELAEAWLDHGAASDATAKPERIKALRSDAEQWLRQQGVDAKVEDALTDIVRGIHVDGYAIGSASAHAAADASDAGLHAGSVAAEMAGWTPGAADVARELVGDLGDGSGLLDMLDKSDGLIRSVAASRLDDLARTLADGVENGSSPEELAQAVAGVLSDPSKADLIASTELARASNEAAVWAYRQRGVDRVIWVTCEDDRVCLVCDANEAAGPRPLGENFPSGDSQPPAHPRDRCAVVPA